MVIAFRRQPVAHVHGTRHGLTLLHMINGHATSEGGRDETQNDLTSSLSSQPWRRRYLANVPDGFTYNIRI